MKVNKDMIKGIAIGIIFSLVLSATSVIASGSSYVKNLEAVFKNTKLVVDGKQVNVVDGNGKSIEPFIVDGVTYLPIRGVSQALGANVGWDGINNTIHIVSSNPSNNAPERNQQQVPKVVENKISITDLEPKSGSNFFIKQGSTVLMHGSNYDYVNGFFGNTNVEYNLLGSYKRLTGIFGITEDQTGFYSQSATLTIYGDGKLIDTITAKKSEAPKKVDISIEGVKELKINITGDSYNNQVNFINVELIKR